jgi:hypothetical protein
MNNADELWERMQSGGERQRAEQLARRDANYEQTVVLQLLRAAGSTSTAKQHKQDRLSAENSDRLDLAWFREQFPRFPLRLSAAKIAWAHEAVADLFLAFEQSTAYKAFADFVETSDVDPSEDAVGIVFPIVQHGNMVLHTYQGNDYIKAREQPKKRDRGAFYYDTDFDRTSLILETFPRLLKKLGDSWWQ